MRKTRGVWSASPMMLRKVTASSLVQKETDSDLPTSDGVLRATAHAVPQDMEGMPRGGHAGV